MYVAVRYEVLDVYNKYDARHFDSRTYLLHRCRITTSHHIILLVGSG